MRAVCMLLCAATLSAAPVELSLKRAVQAGGVARREHARQTRGGIAEAGGVAERAGEGRAAAGPFGRLQRAEPHAQSGGAGDRSGASFPFRVSSSPPSWDRSTRSMRVSRPRRASSISARSGATRRRRWWRRRRAADVRRQRGAGGGAGGAGLPGGAARRRRRGSGEGQPRALRGGAEAGGESEGGGHRHGHRDHAGARAAGQRPAAAAGGGKRAARAPDCNCCGRWACGSTPSSR